MYETEVGILALFFLLWILFFLLVLIDGANRKGHLSPFRTTPCKPYKPCKPCKPCKPKRHRHHRKHRQHAQPVDAPVVLKEVASVPEPNQEVATRKPRVMRHITWPGEEERKVEVIDDLQIESDPVFVMSARTSLNQTKDWNGELHGLWDSIVSQLRIGRSKIRQWLPGVMSVPRTALAPPKELTAVPSAIFTKGGGGTLQIFVGCGINYYSMPDNYLPTCWNDVRAMHRVWQSRLTNVLSVQKVFLATDDTQYVREGRAVLPTTRNWQNILQTVQNLAQEQHERGGTTEIFLVYSGHGYFQRTIDPDEHTGQSQCLVMIDGFYWDFQMAQEFLIGLPPSTHVLAAFDSCHSGTVMNLPWSWDPRTKSCRAETRHMSTMSAQVWMISGCQDLQTSSAGITGVLSVLTDYLSQLLSDLALLKLPITQLYAELVRRLAAHHEQQLPELCVSHTNHVLVPVLV